MQRGFCLNVTFMLPVFGKINKQKEVTEFSRTLGLLIASRSRSEELTGGLLNLATWPMMILSGVWFSLEGSPEFIQTISMALPLTHLVEGARAIMTEGASLMDIKHHVLTLLSMIAVFLSVGTLLFRWEGDGR